ncbi:MAG: hypothetical protein KME36_18435 [Candidatus Thiodiazotropha sp. (ex Lucina pensylvanica)]|nr:hypothetical protein [Candidatus Thiodiazotropha sp. (ex Lucina pensylvanica)]MBT3052909.1 hypothetical protein [Candidatus Thiodiazotropha sp. (ex Codakia orbicularis)]
MFVTFQFPISDARPFEPQLDLRVSLPDWPDPTTSINPHFVHYFGQAYERNRDADMAWPDEIKFCSAKRALRFKKLESHNCGPDDQQFHPVCAFRRFFSDGLAVARLDIGIRHSSLHNNITNLELKDVLTIVSGLTELPTTVRQIKNRLHTSAIIRQGKALADLYACASMKTTNHGHSDKSIQLVEACNPLILVELEDNEANIDYNQKGITAVSQEETNGAKACFCRLQTNSGIISTWILQKSDATKSQLRSLRICLTRLHTEQEVLDRILKQIHRKRLLHHVTEEVVDQLDNYFNERTKIIDRNKWAGINQSQILSAYDATKKVMRPAIEAQLVSRYNGARRQVWKKIERYQERRNATRLVYAINVEEGAYQVKNVTVSGSGNIVNVAEYMSNITNTVNSNLEQSNIDDAVKDLITKLNQQIDGISSKADPAQTTKMGKNLKQLSEEVASSEPDRRWYQLSLEGIKEAAEAIGDIANPVLETVAKLVKFLL